MTTFEDVLKACASGKMPKVTDGTKIGQIVTIKNGDGYHGVGVYYEGVGYVKWYHAKHQDDHRSKYMSQLTIVE